MMSDLETKEFAAQTFVNYRFPINNRTINIGLQYFQALFKNEAIDAAGALTFSEILEKVISEQIDAVDPSNVLVQLSSGLDSGAVLGALLKVLEKEKVSCVTVGEPRSADVTGAKSLCARLGLKHYSVDPNKYDWELEKAIDKAKSLHFENGVFMEALYPVIADSVAGLANSNTLVLTGYLGDCLGGMHLGKVYHGRGDANKCLDADYAAKALLRMNSTSSFLVGGEKLVGLLSDVLQEDCVKQAQKKFRGLSSYDVLNVVLRQALRVRVVGCHSPNVFAPFSDPRVVGYWFQKDMADRIGKRRYRQELFQMFPNIFRDVRSSKQASSFRLKAVRYISRKTEEALFKAGCLGRALQRSERGDPFYNESLKGHIEDLATGFRARRFDFMALELSDPIQGRTLFNTGATPLTARSAAILSAELHLRAGTL